MPCYRPLHGWRSRNRTENGKRGIVFDRKSGYEDMPVTVACGRCIGCRLEYARQWSIRCMHEASLHGESSFITLTYDDAHLPLGASLVPRHMTLFIKLLRYHAGRKLRYYYSGEYGETNRRPHYHACIFGYFPSDAEFYSEKNGYYLYHSEELNRIWKRGDVKTGTVTAESAGYTARYICKKLTGKKAEEINPITGLQHYETMTEDGEIITLQPEFARMSQSLGAGWLKTYGDETFRDDSVIVDTHPVKPPKAYEKHLTEEETEKLKARRKKQAEKRAHESTEARLRVREEVKLAQISHLGRS